MKKRSAISLMIVTAVSALSVTPAFQAGAAEHDKAHVDNWSAVKQVVAVLHPTAGNKCSGKVTFTQMPDGVKIVAHLEGLTPGQ